MTLSMRPWTAIEFAASAVMRWREQYSDWNMFNRFGDGRTKGDVDETLDNHQHTPENIARIINPGWAYPPCSCCGELRNVVVSMKEEWSETTLEICLPCAEKAVSLLSQFDGAREAVSKAAPKAPSTMGEGS